MICLSTHLASREVSELQESSHHWSEFENTLMKQAFKHPAACPPLLRGARLGPVSCFLSFTQVSISIKGFHLLFYTVGLTKAVGFFFYFSMLFPFKRQYSQPWSEQRQGIESFHTKNSLQRSGTCPLSLLNSCNNNNMSKERRWSAKVYLLDWV